MIEIEKRFNPTEEQLAKLIAESEFVGQVTNHDIYYDYKEGKLFRNYVKFRSRNGAFEIKIDNRNLQDKTVKAEEEIEDEMEIKKYFNTEKNLQDFVAQEMIVWSDYYNDRKKYRNGDFQIDVDNLDFGYKVVEIELMVENENEIKEAQDRIVDFAKKYNFDLGRVPSKGEKYFQIVKPELYKELYLK